MIGVQIDEYEYGIVQIDNQTKEMVHNRLYS